jgi:hypothetical protein|tara:strand:+ start:1104 stop:1385 length:282 start_codon:yes stop_codon:yes gene_type:complete
MKTMSKIDTILNHETKTSGTLPVAVMPITMHATTKKKETMNWKVKRNDAKWTFRTAHLGVRKYNRTNCTKWWKISVGTNTFRTIENGNMYDVH